MTDKEKLTKIRAEIERTMNWEKEQTAHTYGNLCQLHECKADMCDKFLSFIDSMQKEPKECMYSKDGYTDEDRKALCDGCKEECKFNKKEEPINDSFEIEVKNLWMEINTGHNYSIVDSYNQFYGLCMEIAEWQKQKDANLIFNAKEDGYRLGFATMKQQMMAKAIRGHVGQTINGMLRALSDETFGDMGFTAGDKVKLIIIKED